MFRILLIEDRIERQKIFVKETGFDFNKYTQVLDNRTSLDGIDLDKYSAIICHRSAFGESTNNVLDRLKEHCKKTETQLVFFSGGISSTFYSKTTYEFLLLNSKSFYNQNLEIYLDKVMNCSTSNLGIIAYGENWKINQMLDVLTKVNIFISQNINKEKIKAQRLKTYSQLNNIKEIVDIEYPTIFTGGAILLDDLQKFATKLNNKINQEVLMNG